MNHIDKDTNSEASGLKDLIVTLVRALVDDPAAVQVNEISGSTSVIYEVSVAKTDVGKIVGKQGRNLAAVRMVVNSVGAKLGRRAILELIEPD